MQSYIAKIIQNRKWVILFTALVTVALMTQLRSLSIIIDPDNTLPQTHPYIVTNNKIEALFGNKFTVVIGITPKTGDIYQESVLKKVQGITQRLQNAPGVVKSNIISFSARKAKNITGNEEGMIVKPMMEKVPSTPAEMEEFRKIVDHNPIYENLLYSKDRKTTQVVAEFKKIDGGFKAISDSVNAAVDPDRDDTVTVEVAGIPVFLALLETYSQRMAFLFPIALLIIGLIHYEAFRTVQALVLPLVTAVLAVIWALGILGLMKEPFDVFNSSTPILILAIAAGHAVQILKRYYEEYSHIQDEQPTLDPKELSRLAVLRSLTKVGPVMVVACTVAALGFFSLMIFEIKTIRTFGIFTGAGVLSALVLELTFIPALRVLIPPPGKREIERERAETFWDRLTMRFYRLARYERKKVYITSAIIIAVLSLGGYWLKIENSQKSYFYGQMQARIDDDRLNERMAGTNTLYVLVEGKKEDDIKRPDVLKAMDQTQEFLKQDTQIGKVVSLVDFLKKMNYSMNADKPEFNTLPDNQDLVAQYLLLYSNSGEPGDFDNYVDYVYQRASITGFIKTDNSSYVDSLAKRTSAFANSVFPKDVDVSVGGGTTGGVALNEVMVREKVLNILQIMSAVFLISALVFRSAIAGLFILVPLVAAVMVNFGIMGLLGIPLQIATSLVSAMAVGIGADYGIYMSYRMREELQSNPNEEEAIEKAFRSAGKAALFVSSAVAGGFGVLMFSFGFMIHLWSGFLIGTAMLVSSVAALTIFPSLILTFRPNFIFKNAKKAKTVKPTFDNARTV